MTDAFTDQERLRRILADGQQERFAPGFAYRATVRWQTVHRHSADGTLQFEAAVARLFIRFAPLAAAAAVILAVDNVQHRSAGQSIVRALVGAAPPRPIPPSLETIYDLGTLVVPDQE